jgi:hypothetical protein
MKIGKSASEPLPLLTSSIFEWHRRFKEGEKTMFVCFFDHKGTAHYEFIAQGQTVNKQCYWKCSQGYGSLFGGKDRNSDLISRFSTMTMPLRTTLKVNYKNGPSTLFT